MSKKYCQVIDKELLKYDNEILMPKYMFVRYSTDEVTVIMRLLNKAFEDGRKNAQYAIRTSLGLRED